MRIKFALYLVAALSGLLIIDPVFSPYTQGGARETLSGPIPATVLKVFDGDTVIVRARIWLGQAVETKVRLTGINAPELNGRCEKERHLAQRARQVLTEAIDGKPVSLSNIVYGKYAGRVLASLAVSGGGDASLTLIKAGLARPYSGGKRRSWCGEGD